MAATTAPGAETMTVAAYRDAFRRWLAPKGEGARVLAPFRARSSLAEATHTHEQHVAAGTELTKVLWAAGWKRYGWPAEVGGLGGGPRYRAVYYDELCRAGLFVPESDLPTEVLAPAILKFAPAVAAELLPRLLGGEEQWGQGLSEPDAGSDLASLRTRAVLTPYGFRVSGQKTWMSNGHLADRLFTLVRTGTTESRHRGLTVLMIDADAPGVTRRPLVFASGVTELCEVFYDDVDVPVGRLVGAVDEGWSVAMYLLQYERSMYAVQRQAWLFARLRDLARLLSADACVPSTAADRLGRAWAAVNTLRARTAETVRRLDEGQVVGPEASADKVLLATAEQEVFDSARDLLGERFLLDPAAARWREQWWYSRAASIYGGSAEVQRSILADRVLRLPAENPRPQEKS